MPSPTPTTPATTVDGATTAATSATSAIDNTANVGTTTTSASAKTAAHIATATAASTTTTATAISEKLNSTTPCWLCLPANNNCEARVRQCLMEQFRSAHTHVCTGYLEKYFQGGEQQGQYYPKPSKYRPFLMTTCYIKAHGPIIVTFVLMILAYDPFDALLFPPPSLLGDNDVDTPERKNRRMAQVAEVVYDNVAGFTGYGMVLKVRKQKHVLHVLLFIIIIYLSIHFS